MFGLFNHRTSDRTPRTQAVVRRAAAWEPLEPRQFLSITPFDATGLTVTYTKSTLPTSVLTGANIKGSVTLQLTNSSPTNDTGVNAFNVYASTDSVIDATDPHLGELSRKLNLKTGKTLKLTVPVKTSAPLGGDYNILISATNAAGVTSTTEITPAPSLVVAPSFVSLSASIGAASPTAFSGAKTITFKATLTNVGNVNSTGVLTTTVGLSTDGVTAPTTSLVSQMRKVTVKPNGRAVALTFHVKVPAGTAAGTYYPAVTFTQGTAAQVVAFSTTPITIGIA